MVYKEYFEFFGLWFYLYIMFQPYLWGILHILFPFEFEELLEHFEFHNDDESFWKNIAGKNILLINHSLLVKLECSCGLITYSSVLTGKNNSSPANIALQWSWSEHLFRYQSDQTTNQRSAVRQPSCMSTKAHLRNWMMNFYFSKLVWQWGYADISHNVRQLGAHTTIQIREQKVNVSTYLTGLPTIQKVDGLGKPAP
jgi:hypothetical protein